ncbi:MAG: tryptophan--tRNA ligase, partial [Clostridia bacterium]|nr:tryptophan--tRNA ligase [Clostridia bacterium]
PAHAELSWILNCYTMFGELSRMTQFKDKSQKNASNVNAGLFDYHVLMASDILLYQTGIVPVGIDQKQHIELARDIAMRFNQVYGDVFTVPEGYMEKNGTKIMSLQDPKRNMSKSYENENASVGILDPRDVVMRKFKRAVTDSDTVVRFADGKDGINNLMTIYSCFTGKTMEEIEKEFDGKGYGDFKLAVGETVADGLEPVRNRFNELMADKAYLESIMKNGADKANYMASKTLSKVYKKVGFVPKIR